MEYQKRGDGSKGQSLVTSKVGIREEGPNQGCHVCCATDDINECYGCHVLHMEDTGQVDREV